MTTNPPTLRALRIHVEGQLLRPAGNRVTTDGVATLLVLLDQGKGSLPLLAEWRFGQGSAAQFTAQRAARKMPAGTHVHVYGHDLVLDRFAGQEVLRLGTVELITHPTTNHHEPAANAA